MCIKCHQHLNDETVLKQITENQDFKQWNTTSVSHVWLASSGFNGEECTAAAFQLLDELREWIISNGLIGLSDDPIFDQFGSRNTITVPILDRMIEYSHQNRVPNQDFEALEKFVDELPIAEEEYRVPPELLPKATPKLDAGQLREKILKEALSLNVVCLEPNAPRWWEDTWRRRWWMGVGVVCTVGALYIAHM